MGPRLMSRGYLRHRTALKLAVPFASMGPRLMSRGYYATQNADKLGLQGFNGAAADEPRILTVQTLPPPAANASMGPRLMSRGYNIVRKKLPVAPVASMGPRLMSRGYNTTASSSSQVVSFNGAAADEPRIPVT